MRGLAVLCLIFILPGCIFDPDKGDGEPEDLLLTPEGTVEQIERAYIRKDIDLYLDALQDTVLFHFKPSDIDVVWPAPTWGKTEEELYHRNMFDQVHQVEIVLVGDVADQISDNPETWTLYREYDIVIYRTENDPDDVLLAYGWSEFEFEVQKCTDGKYRVVNWYDLENPP